MQIDILTKIKRSDKENFKKKAFFLGLKVKNEIY